MKEMNGNAQIIEGVIQDEGAVGYVGVGYLYGKDGKIRSGLKILNISKEANGTAYSPLDKEAVDTKKYPVARALFQAVKGKPSGDIAKFLMWETGPEGQKIVEREGFYTIGGDYKAQNEKNFK
jgi:phosphate transport system substrate-binding protein